MTNQFIDPSPLAKTKSSWIAKYQSSFDTCPVDKSFKIPLDEVKLGTLRPFVSMTNGQQDKKFRVVKHDDCYEIYRKE